MTKLGAQGDIVTRLRADANAHETEGQRAEAADIIERLRRINVLLAQENCSLRTENARRAVGPKPAAFETRGSAVWPARR